MFKIYILLFWEYFKIGFFAVGGGYATLPFLYYLQERYNWYSINDLTNMIAVSNITPGPVGINMATYTGYTTAGFIGSLIATVAVVFAPFIITVILIKLFIKYKSLPVINEIFSGLRPAACALLSIIVCRLLTENGVLNFSVDNKSLIIFLLLIIPFSFFKKNPLYTIITGAISGIVVNIII